MNTNERQWFTIELRDVRLRLGYWRRYGFGLHRRSFMDDDVAPSLERLPPWALDYPEIDRPAAEYVLQKCSLVGPLPIRWFPDARAARAYDPVIAQSARLAFPLVTSPPRILTAAWHAGEPAEKTSEQCHQPSQIPPEFDEPDSTDLLDLFAAGLLVYWLRPQEIICVERPSLRLLNEELHSNDGPAVHWSTGEHYYFRRGIRIPGWIMEEPERITLATILDEANAEIRRCMVERFGEERFLRESGARLIAQDAYGKLWRPRGEKRVLLQVTNGTPEFDGSRRVYFLRVPPRMKTPREAVAWTYGILPDQYDIAVRT